MTMLERCARAIYDAEDPLSGDPIAVLIHMSDHLFWDDRLPGETDIERQREAIRIVCRAAARAVLEVLREPDEGMVEAYDAAACEIDGVYAHFRNDAWNRAIDAASK